MAPASPPPMRPSRTTSAPAASASPTHALGALARVRADHRADVGGGVGAGAGGQRLGGGPERFADLVLAGPRRRRRPAPSRPGSAVRRLRRTSPGSPAWTSPGRRRASRPASSWRRPAPARACRSRRRGWRSCGRSRPGRRTRSRRCRRASRIDADGVAGAVDEVDDAGREDLALGDQLEDPLRGPGVALGRLEDEAVAAGDAKGRNQSGIIAGKLNGVIAATTPTGWRTISTSRPRATPSRFSPLIRCGMRDRGLDRLDPAADLAERRRRASCPCRR